MKGKMELLVQSSFEIQLSKLQLEFLDQVARLGFFLLPSGHLILPSGFLVLPYE